MAQNYCFKKWLQIKNELNKIVDEDKDIFDKKATIDEKCITKLLIDIYLRYVQAVNKLIEVADQLLDPHLSDRIRVILEVTISRALEVKYELYLQENSFETFYDVMIDKEVMPYDVILRIPEYFKEQDNLQLHEVVLKIRKSMEQVDVNSLPSLDNDELDILQSEEVFQNSCQLDDPGKHQEKISAANVRSVSNVTDSNSRDLALNFENLYKNRQDEVIELYNSTFLQAKENWRERFVEQMEEDIEDELREWYMEFYTITQQFPPFPAEEKVQAIGQTLGVPAKLPKPFTDEHFPQSPENWPKTIFSRKLAGAPELGGSALIATEHWINPQEFLKCQEELKVKKKNKQTNINKKTGPGVTSKLKNETKTNNKMFLSHSNCFDLFHRLLLASYETSGTYGDFNDAIIEKAKSNALVDVAFETRQKVDRIIRNELHLLMDCQKVREKPNKKKVQKRRHKELDINSLLKEFVKTGILRRASVNTFKDYYCEQGFTQGASPKDAVDRLLHLCVMPLGSDTIHRLVPLTRSICLVGTQHSAKKTLVNAVAYETSATLFDLSPRLLAHQNMNQKHLNLLMTNVLQVARHMQPTIIVMNDVEKIFYGVTSEEERHWKLHKLRPVFKKLISKITCDERVVFMGLSSYPWLAKGKLFDTFFDEIIFVPPPAYATYSIIYKKALENGGFIQTAALAKASEHVGIPVKVIQSICNKIDGSNIVNVPQLLLPLIDNPKLNEDNKKIISFLTEIQKSKTYKEKTASRKKE